MKKNTVRVIMGVTIMACSTVLTVFFRDPRYLWLNAFLFMVFASWD